MEGHLNYVKTRASLEHRQLVGFLTATGTHGAMLLLFLRQTVLKFA
jgi:hypothetical protein